MASGDKLSLEILIKTIADAKGIETTEAGIKQVAQEFEKAAQAGKPLEVTADSVAGKLKDIGKGAVPPLEAVENATKKVGNANHEAARNVHELGQGYREGAEAGRILSEIAEGNISSIGRLGGVIKALGALIRANPISGIFTIAAAAITILIPIVERLTSSFRSQEKSAEDLAADIDHVGELATKFAELKLDRIQKEFEKTKLEAELVADELKNILELQGKRAEVKAAADIARINADPKLTESAKATQIAAVDQQLVKDQRAREDALSQLEVTKANAALKAATDELARIREEAAKKEAASVAATKALQQRGDDEEALKRAKLEAEDIATSSTANGAQPTTAEVARFVELQTQIEALSKKLKGTSTKQLQDAVEDAKEQVNSFATAVKTAEANLETEGTKTAFVQRKADESKPIIADIRNSEDDKKRTDQVPIDAAARKADADALKAFQDSLRDLRQQKDAAGKEGNSSQVATLTKQISDLLSSFKPGLKDADKRFAEEQKKEQIDFQHEIHDNTGALIKNNQALSQLGKALNEGAKEPAPQKPSTAILADGSVKTFSSDAPKVNKLTNAVGDQVQSAQTPAAPLRTVKSVPQPIPTAATETEAAPSSATPDSREKTFARQTLSQSDNFSGETPESAPPIVITPAPAPSAAPTTPSAAPASDIGAGFSQIESAINGAAKPAPVDVSGVVDAINRHADTTVRVVGNVQTGVDRIAKAQTDAERRIAALERGLQASREATQS